MHAAVSTYLTEALVTLSDVVAIGGKNEWKIQVDQFNSYGSLVPIVDMYQYNLSNWLAHADSLSGGTWGTNITSSLPSGPLPLNDVFAKHYDALLENEPFASGGALSAGTSYNGTISSTDPGDWFTISLTAGEEYRFQLTEGTIADADITLYDSLGYLYAHSNGSLETSTTSVIQGTALVSGTYYIAVNSDHFLGNYTVGFNTADLAPTLTELKDASNTIATPYSLATGQTFHGNMNSADDDTHSGDWIKVTLVAGQEYRLQLTKGTISDADITLYDSLGNLYAHSNGSLETSTTSVIQGTALVSGTYYIAVNSDHFLGNYTVGFNTADLAPTLTELKDASNTIATPYSLATGQTFHGNMNSADDDTHSGDWIKVTLVAGQEYRLQLTKGTISDADITLYDSLGNLYAYSNGSLETSTTSVIQGTALVSGTYYIAVNSDHFLGNYTVGFNTADLAPTLTELKDASNTIATPYSLATGQTFHGNMNSADDDTHSGDWIKVTLVAGQEYRLQLTKGTISDADITLYDSLGNLYAHSNGSLETSTTSVIQGTALVSGTYYIAVNSDHFLGNYTVGFNTADLAPTLTELKDASNTIATPYSLATGQTFHGNMNSADDDTHSGDWIKVTLVAGQEYRLQLTKGTISDADITPVRFSGEYLCPSEHVSGQQYHFCHSRHCACFRNVLRRRQ
jgi:hypothetical protein